MAVTKEKLLSKFPTATQQSWAMNVRILRSTSATSTNKQQSSDAQYIIRASHFDEDTYLAIERSGKLSVMSISNEDTEPFVKMLVEKFNTLWTSKSLVGLTGASFDTDHMTIRLGELRSPSSPQMIRGILCCASLRDADEETAKMVLTDVVETLGFAEAKKFSNTWEDRREEIELWCDALKQRS